MKWTKEYKPLKNSRTTLFFMRLRLLVVLALNGNAHAELIHSTTEYSVYPTYKNYIYRYRFEEEAKQACDSFTTERGYSSSSYCNPGTSGDQPVWSAGWLRLENSQYFDLGTFYYCASYQRYFSDIDKCVSIVQVRDIPGDPGNNGSQCSSDPKKTQPCLSDPINPGTGNMWNTETDYAISTPGRLHLSRTYNSSPFNVDAGVVRTFGTRWTQSFDIKLQAEAVQTGSIQGTCWRRGDTQQIWCETTAPVITEGIPDAVSIVRSDGKKQLFSRDNGTWVAKDDINARLTASYNTENSAVIGWTYLSEHGDRTEHFDQAGRLTSIVNRNGATQRLTYSNGLTNDSSLGRIPADAPICAQTHPGQVLPSARLLCVTDQWGHQLHFKYDQHGRIVKMSDPANLETAYTYDGPSGGCSVLDPENRACSANNLTQVRYPDGSTKTYYYNEEYKINNGVACTNTSSIGNGFVHLINSMTGIVDGNGRRHATWTYDCVGRATSTFLDGETNKATVSYGTISSGLTSTTVTHHAGSSSNPQTSVTRYDYQMIQGVMKNTVLEKPCIECGPTKSRTYDTNGNVLSAGDWNGNQTCYAYDTTRNLETMKIEGAPWNSTCTTVLSGSAPPPGSRKVSTQWHASYRLPTAIAEPYKRTTFSYDDKGNLLARSEHATTDSTGIQAFNATTTGASRTWRYTYNDIGQVLTATDPLGAITAYTYDEFGNLATVTDTAGQVTTLSHYDANGHVGKIVDPNGIVTTLTYSPRGWLVTKTTGNDTTLYDYDGVGQLTTVTLPDGSSLYYSYDDAHRLTTMADSHGNRIAYTLDLRGNRMAEHITDPDGTLTRQTSRVYDALSRLQQATGAGQ